MRSIGEINRSSWIPKTPTVSRAKSPLSNSSIQHLEIKHAFYYLIHYTQVLNFISKFEIMINIKSSTCEEEGWTKN